MSPSKAEIAARISRFEDDCRRAGLTLTHPRREIFRVLASCADHPSAEEVHRRVSEQIPGIAADTVYRNLHRFHALGLIGMLGASRERMRFDANLERHHHFICARCGLTRDFVSPALDQLPMPDAVRRFGRPLEMHVEVRGLCSRCAPEVAARTPSEAPAGLSPTPQGHKRRKP